MVQRLSRQDGVVPVVTQQHAPQQQGEVIQPKGWGAPKGNGQADVEHVTQGTAHPDQRQRIQEQIAPQSPADQVRSAFSRGVSEQTAAIQERSYGDTRPVGHVQEQPVADKPAPATRARRSRTAAPATAAEFPPPDYSPESMAVALVYARARILAVAFNDPSTTVDDGLEIARELMVFVSEG